MLNNLKNIFNISERQPNAASDKNNVSTNRFTGRTSDDSEATSKHAQNSEEDVDLNQSQAEAQATPDERTIKSQLELLNGVPQRLLSYWNIGGGQSKILDSNIVSTSRNNFKYHKYTSDFSGFMRLVLKVLLDFDTILLCLMLASTFVLAPRSKMDYLLPSALLTFQLLGRSALEIVVDQRRTRSSQRYNFNLVKKYFRARVEQTGIGNRKDKQTRREGTFAYDLWQHLKVGDLITLRRGQECPADVLIIDVDNIGTQSRQKHKVVAPELQPQYTFVNSQLDDILVYQGTSRQFNIRSKKCFQGTYERNRSEGQIKISPLTVAQNFSGVLIWEWNKSDFFTAQFRFADNSGSYDISHESLILRGSRVESNHKMVCVVLNVGSNCHNNVERRPPFSFSFQYVRRSFARFFWPHFPHKYSRFMHYAKYLGFAVFVTYIALTSIKLTHSQIQNFESAILSNAYGISDQEFQQGDASGITLTLLRLFNQAVVVVPLFFSLTAECISICQAYFVEWDINLVPANLSFNNLKAVRKLPWIGHIVTSPAAIEGEQSYKVTYFRVGNTSLHSQDMIVSESAWDDQQKVQDKNTQSNIADDESIETVSSDDQTITLDYYPHTSMQRKSQFQNQALDQILVQKNNSQTTAVCNFIRILCLCHSAMILSKREQIRHGAQSQYQSFNPEEEAQLIFAQQYNYVFKAKKSNVITLQVQKMLERYEELAYVRLKLAQGKSHVTVQILQPFNNNGNITINLKGSVNSVIDCVRDHQYATYKQSLVEESERFTQIGYTVQAFCQRELSRDESIHLKSALDGLNTYKKTFKAQLEKVCSMYLSQMEIVGVLGLQKRVNYRNTLAVEDMVNNNVKMWLLSQQSWRKTMTNVSNLNLLNGFQRVELSGKTDREVEESLRLAFISVFESEIKSRKVKLNLVLNNSLQKDASEMQSEHGTSKEDKEKKISKFDKVFTLSKKLKMVTEATQNKSLLSGKNQINQRVKRALVLNGETLQVILRDENGIILFLTLAMYCDIVVGCAIPPQIKGFLARNIKKYQANGTDGNLMYVAGVIGSPEDRYLLEKDNTDLVMTISNKLNPQLHQVEADIRMESVYALTYLLLKHGSQLIRRLNVAGRLAVKRSVFFALLLIGTYIMSGWSAVCPFSEMQLAFYLTLIFQTLLFTTVVTYKVDAFNDLHRVNGQYQCNSTFKVFSLKNLANSSMEFSIDLIVVVLLSGIGQIYQTCISRERGFALQSQAFALKVNVVVAAHTVVNFVRFPLVTTQNLLFLLLTTFLLITSLLLDDTDLVGFKTVQLAPQFLFDCVFVVLVFGLKLALRLLIREWVPETHKFDVYNLFVHERLILEQFESLEQIQSIGLDNVRHSKNLIDAYELNQQRLNSYINQNLLKLTYRSELSELIFEQLGHIRAIMQSISDQTKLETQYDDLGLGWAHNQIYRQQVKQVDFRALKFKFMHQQQDFYKNQLLTLRISKAHTNNMIVQIGVMGAIYLALFVVRVIETMNDSSNQTQTYFYYVICFALCLVALLMVRQAWPIKRQATIICLIFALNLLTMLQVQTNRLLNVNKGSEVFVVAVLLLFSLLNRTVYLRVTVFVCLISSFWFLGLQIFSTVDGMWLHSLVDEYMKKNEGSLIQKDTYYFTLLGGFPLFVAVNLVNVYWDEIAARVSFATMDTKIKNYKKLRSCMQRLVPEIVRKLQNKKDHNVEVSRSLVLVQVKITNYQQLFCSNSLSDEQVYQLVQRIYAGIDKLVTKHGLLRQQAHEDRIEIIGGLKLFEQGLSQKVLSAPAIQRACKLAFDVHTFGSQMSRSMRQQISFQVAIHCPGNTANGVIGALKPTMCLMGSQHSKILQIVDRTPPGHICISKESYDTLVNMSIFYNMKVVDRIKIENQSTFENIYELLEKRKQLMRPKMTNAVSRNPGQNQPTEEQGVSLDPHLVDSSGDSSLFSASAESENVDSRQIVQESNSNPELAGSTFVKADYQMHFQSIKEFRDDQEIADNPILNQTYKLVQRKGFLLNFRGFGGGEQKFFRQLNYEYMTANLFLSSALLLLTTFTIFQFTRNLVSNPTESLLLFWLLPIALILPFIAYNSTKLTERKANSIFGLNLVLTCLFAVFSTIDTASQCSPLQHSQAKMLLLCVYVVVYAQKTQLFKYMAVELALITGASLSTYLYCFHEVSWLAISLQFTGELAIFSLLICCAYHREMNHRIDFNRHVMIQVESKRNQEIAQKLLPSQALTAIKQDQNFYECVENATICIVSIVGFTDFINSKDIENKPQQAFNLLNQIYTRFDELVEQYGLFKIQSDAYTYTVMSDPSSMSVPVEKIQQQQAYQVTIFASELAKVVTDVCQHTLASSTELQNTQYLMRLGLQIGIHSGNLVTCVTGTKFQQFQVFGKTSLAAAHVKQSAPRDQICITSQTKEILLAQQQQQGPQPKTLEFTEHLSVIREGMRGSFQTFTVQVRSAVESSSSSKDSSYSSVDGDSSNDSESSSDDEQSDNSSQAMSGDATIPQ